MTQNEYLIEAMSKVDKFTDWVAKYHEVYSSDNNDITCHFCNNFYYLFYNRHYIFSKYAII